MNNNLLRDCLHNLRRRYSCVRLFIKRKWGALLARVLDFIISQLWEWLCDMCLFWLFVRDFLLVRIRNFVIFQLWRRLSDLWTLLLYCVRGFVVLFVALGLLALSLFILNPHISENTLFGIAFAIAGIIGASIAIMFSFSSFILQNAANLFSTEYLDHFADDPKDKRVFGWLVFLTMVSFFIPPIFGKYNLNLYALVLLLIIFLIAFRLIYEMYLELRKRINPKNFLAKIKINAFKEMEKISKEEGNKKSNPASNHIKHLQEVGLRLLARSDIYGFNLAIQHIQDIYLKHLELNSDCFIRRPESFLGSYDCDDGGVTRQILECLQSMSVRTIEEKRQENIFALLHVYKNIFEHVSCIKYADDIQEQKNPLLGAVLLYYRKFIVSLLASREGDWVLGVTSSLSAMSKIALQKTDENYTFSQIHEMMKMVPDHSPNETREACLLNLAIIYFDQIKGSRQIQRQRFFWQELFQGLENVVLLASPSTGAGSILNDFFLNFYRWQESSAEEVLDLKRKEGQKESLSDFVTLLKKWSGFLLNFARKNGLNIAAGFFIIYSVKSNLNTIFRIRSSSQKPENMHEIYKIQFDVFSLYFRNTDKLDDHLRNLDLVLETLLQEICNNLAHKFFDVNYLINKYVELIEKHFDAVGTGDEYTRPRIIEKLVYLGLLLSKYGKTSEEAEILSKMDELNNKHLVSHKGSLQLCKEIHDLGWNLLYGDSLDALDSVLRAVDKGKSTEAKKREWDNFAKKINCCKDYNLVNIDPIGKYGFPPN